MRDHLRLLADILPVLDAQDGLQFGCTPFSSCLPRYHSIVSGTFKLQLLAQPPSLGPMMAPGCVPVCKQGNELRVGKELYEHSGILKQSL